MLIFKTCSLINQMVFVDFPYEEGDGRHLSFGSAITILNIPTTVKFRYMRLVVEPTGANARLTLSEGSLQYNMYPYYSFTEVQRLFWFIEAHDYGSLVLITPVDCEYYFQVIEA